MKRFQIADAGKEWNDHGPDLLRGVDNARGQIKSITPQRGDLSWRKNTAHDGWGDWKGGALDRAEVLAKFDAWAEAPGFNLQVFQIGAGNHPGENVTARAKAHLITVAQHDGATDRAEQAWAMYDRMWPGTTFAGIYTCKPYSHGHGDAVDVSYGPTAKVFDWGLRMAKNGLIACEQIIGTENGRDEVTAWRDEDYRVKPYNGNGSHTWHCHHGCGHAHDESPPCMD